MKAWWKAITLYDSYNFNGCLAVDEVTVCINGGSFIGPHGLTYIIQSLQQSAAADTASICGSVIIIHPHSFSVLNDSTKFILFGSHAHGSEGALCARAPFHSAVDYLKYFLLGVIQDSNST